MVDGDDSRAVVNQFVETMPSIDSLQLRKKIVRCTPDIDLKTNFECPECGISEKVVLPIGIGFLYPDLEK